MLAIVENEELFYKEIELEGEKERQRAEKGYHMDPNIATKPIAKLPIRKDDALYLLEILPRWVEYYEDMQMEANSKDQMEQDKLSAERARLLLEELRAADVESAVPGQLYLIEVTPLDNLGSIFEMQVDMDLYSLRNEPPKSQRRAKFIADRIEKGMRFGRILDRFVKVSDSYAYRLYELYAEQRVKELAA